MLNLSIGDIEIALCRDDAVYMPSPLGILLAKNLDIQVGQTVLDIGTGSGIQAIVAAKKGGIVTATDINACAIDLTQINARLNQVQVHCIQGSYFAEIDSRFDVIIANMPHSLLVAHHLGQLLQPRESNQAILYVLDHFTRYLNPSGKLLLSFTTAFPYQPILKKLATLQSSLLAFDSFPIPHTYLENYPDWKKHLSNGDLFVYQQEETFFQDAYIWKVQPR